MAALAYLFLPVSGALAFLLARSARVKAHGLQAIVIGTVWALFLYGASAIAAALTWVVAVVGLIAWLGFGLLTATGRDPKIPVLGEWFFNEG